MYGISNLAFIPIRKEPDERSEMVSQLLFGETYLIQKSDLMWSYIRTDFDNYEGWINNRLIVSLSEESHSHLNQQIIPVLANPISIVQWENNQESTFVPSGSCLPGFNPESGTCKIKDVVYKLNEGIKVYHEIGTREQIQTVALTFLYVPYLWGGKSVFGTDCSGLVQTVFKINGYKLPRDAKDQVLQGRSVNFLKDAQTGDLAFFDDDKGNIVHAGILLNPNQIIHASGYVKINIIDHTGIIDKTTGKYSHRLKVIKDVVNDN